MSRVTLWGIYQYDPELFKEVNLPEGLDIETLIDAIMLRCGDLYSYIQSPTYLKYNITKFFNRNFTQFERMLKALQAEYNPIENYDRYEEWTDTPNIKVEQDAGNESKISAFNSSSYQPRESATSNASSLTSGNTKHEGHLHGNIGVTTNATMVSEELRLREYDIYDHIAEVFERKFIVQIY